MAQKKRLKFGFLAYWKPTPIFLRKIGDTFLGVSTFLATLDNFEHPKKTVVILICGIAGKVFTNLFTIENEK
jgi:Fe2+ transport system protein B